MAINIAILLTGILVSFVLFKMFQSYHKITVESDAIKYDLKSMLASCETVPSNILEDNDARLMRIGMAKMAMAMETKNR